MIKALLILFILSMTLTSKAQETKQPDYSSYKVCEDCLEAWSKGDIKTSSHKEKRVLRRERRAERNNKPSYTPRETKTNHPLAKKTSNFGKREARMVGGIISTAVVVILTAVVITHENKIIDAIK